MDTPNNPQGLPLFSSPFIPGKKYLPQKEYILDWYDGPLQTLVILDQPYVCFLLAWNPNEPQRIFGLIPITGDPFNSL